MARLCVMYRGKFLVEGSANGNGFESLPGGKVRVLQFSYIGETFQLLNLNGVDGVTNVAMSREDGTGSPGDRVAPADAIQWG